MHSHTRCKEDHAMDFVDHYAVLGISDSADIQTIKAAYHRLAKQHHPDKNKSSDANRRMQEIVEAHSVLRDPRKRAEYDFLRAQILDEVRLQADATRRAEDQRRAEASRQAEARRQAEVMQRQEAERQAAAHRAEAARQAEFKRQAENAQREAELAFWRELAEQKHRQALARANRIKRYRRMVLTTLFILVIACITTLIPLLTALPPYNSVRPLSSNRSGESQIDDALRSSQQIIFATNTPSIPTATSTPSPTDLPAFATMTAAVATLTQAARPTNTPTPFVPDINVSFSTPSLLYIASDTPVRTCPHSACNVLAQLPAGSYITVLGVFGGESTEPHNRIWYRVLTKERQHGYIYSGQNA